jgi:hypothetical protein
MKKLNVFLMEHRSKLITLTIAATAIAAVLGGHGKGDPGAGW